MNIPFGLCAPNPRQLDQLQQLGFDLTKIIYKGRYYFLEIPNDPRIQVKKTYPKFSLREIKVNFNGINVISIDQKVTMYAPSVIFHLYNENIKQALLIKECISEKKQELTEYQKRLDCHLRRLEDIVFKDGAPRGYGRMISFHLQKLTKLRGENLDEHSKFIASNENYTKLYEMFPNWTDVNDLQKKYEAMDIGPWEAIHISNYDGAEQQCRLM